MDCDIPRVGTIGWCIGGSVSEPPSSSGPSPALASCLTVLEGCWPVNTKPTKCHVCEGTQQRKLQKAGCTELDIATYCTNSNGGRCSNVRDLYEQMYPLAAEHHRFIIYPPAYGTMTSALKDHGEGLQLANLTWYVNWAREDTRIVGFSPYQYGDDNVPYDLGASSLPTLWKALVDLGRQIVGR